jgi:N-acetylglutamate synthase-like GNAT family acetyltransferase
VHFTVTTDETLRRADEIVDYLRGPCLWIPRLDYPDFDRWTERVHAQLKSEAKRAVVTLSGGNVVGAVIYQRHEVEEAIEVKNVTVRPDQQGRYVASFMLRNAEIEGATDFGVGRVIVDAKAKNLAIRSFLLKSGYRPVTTTDLYGLGAGADILYEKAVSTCLST